jgi:competence protein ComEA
MVVSFRAAPDPAAPRGPRWRVGLGAVVVLVLALLAVTVAVSAVAGGGGAGETAITSPPGPVASGTAGPGASAAPGAAGGAAGAGPAGPVFVHVHGQVARPGLYELPAGSRVVDVVAAAGGFTPEAEQAAVNLARPVVDGEQLGVPAVGEIAPGASGAGGALGGAGAGVAPGTSAGAGSGGLVDLNRADDATLQTLPGVGPATAAAILEWRAANGSFRSVDDLLGVPGIGEKTLEKLRALVTV